MIKVCVLTGIWEKVNILTAIYFFDVYFFFGKFGDDDYNFIFKKGYFRKV